MWRGGNFRDEVVVGAVLTQGTSWSNVERALRNLEEAGIRDLEAIHNTPDEELDLLLKPAVYVRRKVRTLKELYPIIYGRKEPPKREELLKVFGIGEETADVILLYAYGVPVVVLDGYTRRWAERFFGREVRDEELRNLLMIWRDTFYLKELHALLDELGKRYCRKVPRCEDCPLAPLCRYPHTTRPSGL